jgi:quinoprotein glucose dehydrogenase
VKGVFQATKQAFLYALDRETGEPIWPIEERPVPQSDVPGEQLAPTQPFPTRPAAYDLQGRQPDHLIDWTPEIYERAYAIAEANDMFAPLFNPPIVPGQSQGNGRACPGATGGTNITGPAVADPVNGIVFTTSHSGCGTYSLMPGSESPLDSELQTGTTYSDWSRASGRGGGGRGGGGGPTDVDGLDIWKGPDGRISAIDMNTGDYLWVIPNGDAPQDEQDFIRNHPLLQGIELDELDYNRGRGGHAAMVVTPNLLLASGQTAEGTPHLFAIDKMTGERVGAIEVPAQTRYGMSSWEHDGHQYVIIQLSDGLAAFGLPAAMPQSSGY